MVTIRLQLAGGPQFQRTATLAGASIKQLGTSADLTSRKFQGAERRTFLMNQALFTIRRFAYGGTLALVGIATAAEKMGLTFNATMEQNQLAMGHFLHSNQLAKNELASLYELAARTPFEFPQLVSAARRFLAFGFSLKQTNQYLKTIGDTAAGLGGGADVIDRMVLVFGQMRASGRVLGNDLLQLEQIGIDVFGALRRQLHFTQADIRKLQQGNLFLPSEVAIPAIMKDLQRQYKGMAEAQSRTMLGLLSTLHDYAAQAMGAITLPLYNRLEKHTIPRIIQLTKDMQAGAKVGGARGAISAVDSFLGLGGGLVTFWDHLNTILSSTWSILSRSVIPVTIAWFKVMNQIFPVLSIVAGMLAMLAHHTTLLKLVIGLFLVQLTLEKTAWIVTTLLAKKKAIMLLYYGREQFYVTTASKIAYYWTLKEIIADRLLIATNVRMMTVGGRLIKMWSVLTAFTKGFTAYQVAKTIPTVWQMRRAFAAVLIEEKVAVATTKLAAAWSLATRAGGALLGTLLDLITWGSARATLGENLGFVGWILRQSMADARLAVIRLMSRLVALIPLGLRIRAVLLGWAIQAKATAAATALMGLAQAAMIRINFVKYLVMEKIMLIAVRIQTLLDAAATVIATTAQWAWNIAVQANPLTWILDAIVLVIVAVVLLAVKWRWFRDLFVGSFKFMRAAFESAFGFIRDMGQRVIGGIIGLFHRLRRIIHDIKNLLTHPWKIVNFIPGAALLRNIPGVGRIIPHAFGGMQGYSGAALVGERGPELMYAPARTKFQPLSNVAALQGAGGAEYVPIIVPVYLGKRQIAEATAKARLDRKARR